MNMNGFQMIVQSGHFSEVHKLHVNQSIDFQTPVTVEVEESGVYQVTILGILDSNGTHVEYVKSTPITISTCTTTISGVGMCMHVCVCDRAYRRSLSYGHAISFEIISTKLI